MNAIHTSKFLSYVLRHHPESIGITLDSGGWVNINYLIYKSNEHGKTLTMEDLKEAVETNNKQRFAISPCKTLIRASQGHSVQVDLGLLPTCPPEKLYHGTASRFLSSIREKGLLPMTRMHVHLSDNFSTAKEVGSRHGFPHVLEVSSGEMYKLGYRFYISENKVWLTDKVPIQFLTL